MATNGAHQFPRWVVDPVPSGVTSGTVTASGQRIGVAQADRDANGNAPMDYAGGYNVSVKAIDDSGGNAVSYGDVIYYVAADTPVLSKKKSGIPVGFARVEGSSGQLIAAGATGTVEVVFCPLILGTADIAPGSITGAMLASGAVASANIATGAVNTAALASLAVNSAKMDMFVSPVIIGTGAAQNTAHGLGVVPSTVMVIPVQSAGGVTLTQGTHTTTNIVVTCTNADKYMIVAIA